MVEAICLLPVLALLLAGGQHLHRIHAAHGHLAQQARRCALLHARAHCDAAALPDECVGILGPARAPGDDARHDFERRSDAAAARVGDHTTVFDSPTNVGPIDDALESLFGRGQLARATDTVVTPMGNETTLASTHHVLCDPEPTPHADVAEQLFETLTPSED